MKRVFLALILCFFSGLAYADEEITLDLSDDEVSSSPSSPVKGMVSTNRFILSEPQQLYIPKNTEIPEIVNELRPILYDSALDSEGKFQFSLRYYGQDTQYLHRYQAVDRMDANYGGQINDKINYNIGVTAKNLNTIDGNQTVASNSFISFSVGENNSFAIGNARLSNSNGNYISFIEDAEYAYGVNDLGVRFSGSSGLFDYAVGAYNLDNALSSDEGLAKGGVLSFKPFGYGSEVFSNLKIGGAFYDKNIDNRNNSSYGLFSSYRFKSLGFRSEVSRSLLGNVYVDNWNIMPELYLTKNLTLRAKHKQYSDYDAYTDEFILDYFLGDKIPKLNNVNFQLKASKTRNLDSSESQKYGFSIKFNF